MKRKMNAGILGLVLAGLLPLAVAHAGQTAGTGAAARSPGKPGAPVTIDYRAPARTRAGKAVEFPLSVKPTAPVDEITVSVQAGNGLYLEMPQTRFYKQAGAEPAGAVNEKIRAMPQAEGRHYVTVIVETRRGTQIRSTVKTIPVQVGDAVTAQKSVGELKTGANGEPIVAMPARETRRKSEE